MEVWKKALEYEDYMIRQRRFFHRIPEPAWEEVKTTVAIQRELENMGLHPVRFDGISGVCAEIRGTGEAKQDRTLLLRADIDGVEMQEETGLPFASEISGYMHATGRDCHIAMLLGAARILSDMKKDWGGRVRILFQAAEESAQGAPEYIKRGILEGVNAVYAAHMYGRLPAPQIDISYGYRMAGADKFDIEIQGVSSHGSLPHLGKDAIAAAAQVIQAIQNYVARENNPLEPLVVSIGTIKGGHQRNTLADLVKMEGTVRIHDPAARKRTEEKLRRVITAAAGILECTANMHYQYMLPPLTNDQKLASIALKAAEKLFGEACITHLPAVMASEDFAFYSENIPGIYINIGCAAPGKENGNHNYSSHFQVEEKVLKNGAALCAQFVMDYLSKEETEDGKISEVLS